MTPSLYRKLVSVVLVFFSVVFVMFVASMTVSDAVQATGLEPMSESEMSQVTGQSTSKSLDKLTTLFRKSKRILPDRIIERVKNTDRFQKLRGRGLAVGMMGTGSTGSPLAQGGMRGLSHVSMLPVRIFQSQLSPRMLMKPEAREVITSDAFVETVEIAGEIAKVFADA